MDIVEIIKTLKPDDKVSVTFGFLDRIETAKLIFNLYHERLDCDISKYITYRRTEEGVRLEHTVIRHEKENIVAGSVSFKHPKPYNYTVKEWVITDCKGKFVEIKKKQHLMSIPLKSIHSIIKL